MAKSAPQYPGIQAPESREDLRLAAYAALHGFKIQAVNAKFDAAGVPSQSLTFALEPEGLHVWWTMSGWRCARLVPSAAQESYEDEQADQFHPHLKDALDQVLARRKSGH
jgi:hypothetical protein